MSTAGPNPLRGRVLRLRRRSEVPTVRPEIRMLRAACAQVIAAYRADAAGQGSPEQLRAAAVSPRRWFCHLLNAMDALPGVTDLEREAIDAAYRAEDAAGLLWCVSRRVRSGAADIPPANNNATPRRTRKEA